MSKKQIVFKSIFFYSFLIYIAFIASNIYTAIFGVPFFMGVSYGLEAIFITTVIVWGLFLWYVWVPIIIFQIIFAIYLYRHKECREYTLKKALKSWKFYIPMMIAAVVAVIAFAFAIFFKYKPDDLTKEVRNCFENANVYIVKYDEGQEEYLNLMQENNEWNIWNIISTFDIEDRELLSMLMENRAAYDYTYTFTSGVIEGRPTNIQVKKAYKSRAKEKDVLRFAYDVEDNSAGKYVIVCIFDLEDNLTFWYDCDFSFKER